MVIMLLHKPYNTVQGIENLYNYKKIIGVFLVEMALFQLLAYHTAGNVN